MTSCCHFQSEREDQSGGLEAPQGCRGYDGFAGRKELCNSQRKVCIFIKTYSTPLGENNVDSKLILLPMDFEEKNPCGYEIQTMMI